MKLYIVDDESIGIQIGALSIEFNMVVVIGAIIEAIILLLLSFAISWILNASFIMVFLVLIAGQILYEVRSIRYHK